MTKAPLDKKTVLESTELREMLLRQSAFLAEYVGPYREDGDPEHLRRAYRALRTQTCETTGWTPAEFDAQAAFEGDIAQFDGDPRQHYAWVAGAWLTYYHHGRCTTQH